MFAPKQQQQGKVLSLTGRLTTMQIVGPPAVYGAPGTFILGCTLPVLPTYATHFKKEGFRKPRINPQYWRIISREWFAPPQRHVNPQGAPH